MLTLTYIPILFVAAGGAIGSVLRYAVTQLSAQAHGGSFPIGTILVNVVGSFAIGLMMARYMNQDSESAKLFFVTGLLGGFTTFSAFSWDALQMLQRGAFTQAALYVGGSVLLSIAAVMLGMALVK
jgi:fluoride exporter